MRRAAFRLYLVTEPRPDLGARVAAALAGAPAGAVGVQVRIKGAAAAELWGVTSALRVVTEAAGAPLLVNERADVARAVGADGVHLPAGAMDAGAVRRFWPDALVGRSAHSPASVRAAAEEGCGLVVAGPVFPTPSKAGMGEPLGLPGLRACRAALDEAHAPGGALARPPPPLFAIGGVDVASARACLEAGADGVACIRAVLDAPDPGAVVAAFLAAFR